MLDVYKLPFTEDRPCYTIWRPRTRRTAETGSLRERALDHDTDPKNMVMRPELENDTDLGADGAFATTTMDDVAWEGRSFNLPVKRSRPVTPAQDDQNFEEWIDIANNSYNDVPYDYEVARDFPASWAAAPQMDPSEQNSFGGVESRPQMRTGCIPCLCV